MKEIISEDARSQSRAMCDFIKYSKELSRSARTKVRRIGMKASLNKAGWRKRTLIPL